MTSFDAVGAVLLVAFMVVPASAAYLLTDRLNRLILIAAVIGVSLASAAHNWRSSGMRRSPVVSCSASVSNLA
ncbi:MAG: metal ABC transporter permease [Anaerolineae bacterium]